MLSFRDLVSGKNVEGGGELIGSNHPTWAAYAKRFALAFVPVSENDKSDVPMVIQGRKLDFHRVKELLQEMDGAYRTLNEDAAKVHEDEPWTTPQAETWDRRSTVEWLAALKVSDECRRLIKSDLAGNNGVAVERQSYLGNLTQIKGGGVEKYWTDTEVLSLQRRQPAACRSACQSHRRAAHPPVFPRQPDCRQRSRRSRHLR